MDFEINGLFDDLIEEIGEPEQVNEGPVPVYKALSVRQPWADLIVDGYKDIENRNWQTKYRGLLLIHAPLKVDMVGWKTLSKGYYNKNLKKPDECVRGAIVGVIDLSDVMPSFAIPRSWWADDDYKFFWYLKNPRRFEFPVKYKGKLGVFDVFDREGEISREIRMLTHKDYRKRLMNYYGSKIEV